MRFVIISDSHIHNYKKFSIGNSRLENCLGVFSSVFNYADDNSIDYILFPGDLFDSQITLPTIVIEQTIKTFNELFNTYPNIKFIAISGNHDHATKNMIDNPAITALSILADTMENFILIDNDNYRINSKLSIYGIPYYDYTEHFYQALKSADKNSILLIHQTPYGISNSNIPAQVEPGDFKEFKHVFCGHIHKSEKLANNFLVVGSPLHRDLSDVGQDKGFYVYDSSNDKLEFHKLNYPEIKYSNSPSSTDFIVPIIEEIELVNEGDYTTSMSNIELLNKYAESMKLKDEFIKAGLSCL